MYQHGAISKNGWVNILSLAGNHGNLTWIGYSFDWSLGIQGTALKDLVCKNCCAMMSQGRWANFNDNDYEGGVMTALWYTHSLLNQKRHGLVVNALLVMVDQLVTVDLLNLWLEVTERKARPPRTAGVLLGG